MRLPHLNAPQTDAGASRGRAGAGRDANHASFSLHFSGPHRYLHTLPVVGSNYVIGSSPNSHIRITDCNLAGKHAVINNVAGILTITAYADALMLVNGKRVNGTVRLKPGDKVTLGPILIVTVNDSSTPEVLPRQTRRAKRFTFKWRRLLNAPLAGRIRRLDFSNRILLTVLVVFGIAATGLVFRATRKQNPSGESQRATTERGRAEGEAADQAVKKETGKEELAAPVPPPVSSLRSEDEKVPAVATDKVMSAVRRVMRRISREDSAGQLDDAVLADVATQIEVYVAEGRAIESMRREVGSLSAVMAAARRENIEPGLVILYALLTVVESPRKKGIGIAEASRDILPELKKLAITFNSKDANSCLLVVAVQREIKQGKKQGDVLQALRDTVKDPQTDRNFKFLYDRGRISKNAYEHVIKFLALGALALEPHSFGVDMNPLPF